MRRGYFFTLDAFVAIMVLIIGILVVLSVSRSQPYDTQALFLSQDIMNTLSSATVQEVNEPYINSLRGNGTITNFDNTLLEQAGEFHYMNQRDTAREFLKAALSATVPPQYGYRVVVNNEVLYNTSGLTDEIEVLATSKTIIYGVANKTRLWGPYNAEFTAWQR